MESAFFYNTFFGVAPAPIVKEEKPLMVAIQELPDELGQLIGKFYWNLNEAFAERRLMRLQDTKEILQQFRNDDTHWWLNKWDKNHSHWFFSPLKLIKVCKKTIKVEKANGSFKLLTFDAFQGLITHRLRDIDRVIANCAYRARPKPQFNGQEHIDILGTHCHAEYGYGGNMGDAYHHSGGMVIDERWVRIQGCERRVLRWVNY